MSMEDKHQESEQVSCLTRPMAHGMATAMALFVAARINSPTLNDTMGEPIVFTFGFFFIFIVFNVFTTKLMKRLYT